METNNEFRSTLSEWLKQSGISFTPESLDALVKNAAQPETLQPGMRNGTGVETIHLVGKSEPMRRTFELIKRVAQTSANVLITGPSGSGKETIARLIHACGPQAHKKFITFNPAGAIPGSMLETELFGAGGGVEQAQSGGTLFIEEVGGLNVALQSKLLRIIQERGNDFRIIASSQVDLKKAVEEGRFREDLFYRLSVIPIEVPALSERTEDIPLLANHFLSQSSHLNPAQPKHITPAAMKKLVSRQWLGNARELKNVIERAALLATGSEITKVEILDGPLASETDKIAGLLNALQQQGGLPTVEELEKRYMKVILEKTKGRKEKAAKILGINRRTLYRKEREYGWIHEDEASPDSGLSGVNQ